MKNIISMLAALATFYLAPVCAEDIDIYNSNPSISAREPKVLIVLANQASWNNMFTFEKQAIVQVVSSLTESVNAGLMMFNQTSNSLCTMGNGAYVPFGIRAMNSTNKEKLASLVGSLDKNGDSGNNADYGLTMYEAYNYFKGLNAYSGHTCRKRDYPGNTNNPFAKDLNPGHAFASGLAGDRNYLSPTENFGADCGSKYIIFISNGKATDSGGENSFATDLAKYYLRAAGGDDGIIVLSPSGAQDNAADEWARFLSSLPVRDRIITYTIDVQDPSKNRVSSDIAHTALLQSMASRGKGRYFSASDIDTLKRSLETAFSEIQAVDSTFASVSLPVTVSVRGSYLNQIYMGTFRPDAQAAPRWPGNLKQYRVASIGGVATLTDKLAEAPLEDAEGFIRDSAISYWTHPSSDWSFAATPTYSASDMPDGPLVEKGGAAQRLRDQYKTSQDARKVYTCIAACSGGAAPEEFKTANANVTASALGLTASVPISALSRSGENVSVTTSANHNLSGETFASITGVTPSSYNGGHVLMPSSGTTLTFKVAMTPDSPDGNAKEVDSLVYLAPTKIISRIVVGKTGGNNFVDFTVNGIFLAVGSTLTITVGKETDARYDFNKTWSGIVQANNSANNTTTLRVFDDALPNSGFTIAAPTAFASLDASSATLPSDSAAVPVQGLELQKPVTGLTATAVASVASAGSFATGALGRIYGAEGIEYNGFYSLSVDAVNKKISYVISTGPGAYVSGGAVQAGSGTRDELINWVRGQDNAITPGGENNNNSMTDIRSSVHGDVIHSRPAVINFGGALDSPAASPNTQRNVVVFYGANDGFLRAVKGGRATTDTGALADGYEIWSIIFPDHFGRLDRLRANFPPVSAANRKSYFVDGSIGTYVKDVNENGLLGDSVDIVRIYPSMRRGGEFIYALDVNNALSSTASAPKFLWKIAPVVSASGARSGDFAELGQTWSEPKSAVIRLLAADNPDTPGPDYQDVQVVVFGGGYDAAHDDLPSSGVRTRGRAVFVVNGTTGALIKRFDSSSVTGMAASIPGDVNLIDRNKDGYLDEIYAVDTAGQVFRFFVGNPDVASWVGYRIADLGGTGENARRFLTMPDVVSYPGYDVVMVGSGNREDPFGTDIKDFFYALRVPVSWTSADLPIAITDLADAGQRVSTEDSSFVPVSIGDATKRGWRLALSSPGEKLVGGATSAFGTVYFATNSPPQYTEAETLSCTSNLGTARLYGVKFLTGMPEFMVGEFPSYYTTVAGGGFLPTPVLAQVPTDEGEIVTVLIAGSTSQQLKGANKKINRWWFRQID